MALHDLCADAAAGPLFQLPKTALLLSHQKPRPSLASWNAGQFSFRSAREFPTFPFLLKLSLSSFSAQDINNTHC